MDENMTEKLIAELGVEIHSFITKFSERKGSIDQTIALRAMIVVMARTIGGRDDYEGLLRLSIKTLETAVEIVRFDFDDEVVSKC